MPSPFPGMNPYLERAAVWLDFHSTYIGAIRVALNAVITPKYFARVGEHLIIHDVDRPRERAFAHADVSVSELSRGTAAENLAIATMPIDLLEPKHVWETDYIEDHITFLEIIDRESLKVVTAIELLSPINKLSGPERDRFIAKRHKLLKSNAHYVEIDLLRTGPKLPWKGLEPCDYYLLVSRVENRPRADIWPFSVRDPIPPLRVPLGSPAEDVVLDLKSLLDAKYDEVKYELLIYNDDPEPALRGADRDWSTEIVRKHQQL